MRTAAMTRIHRSGILLNLWLSYYTRYFDDIYVFAGRYGNDEPGTFEELKEKYNFNLLTYQDEMYGEIMHNAVFAKQKELLQDHSWVLYSDADEIVVADPEKYDGLRHYMDVCREDQTFCRAYEVFQAEGEKPINYDEPILKQREFWCVDPFKSYNKPCLSRIPTDWGMGFHYIQGMEGSLDSIPPMGLYLLHLKHLDPSLELDFGRESTGAHNDISILAKAAEKIPEKVRGIF